MFEKKRERESETILILDFAIPQKNSDFSCKFIHFSQFILLDLNLLNTDAYEINKNSSE